MKISKLVYRGKSIGTVEVPYSPEVVNALRALPDFRKFDPERKVWQFGLTLANIRALRAAFPHANWDASLDPDVAALEQVEQRAADNVTAKRAAEPAEVVDYKFKTTPFNHQVLAFSIARANVEYALFMEQGTGKTKVAIDVACWRFLRGEINALFVVTPNDVKLNWVYDEVPTHTPAHVAYRVAAWQAQPRKGEREALDALWSPGNFLRILVMNVEALSTERGAEYALKFLNAASAMMVVDESTRIKTISVTRTRNAIKCGKRAKFRMIMTGTPITKSPVDAFAQFTFLNPAILGHDSFYSFRNRYAVMGGYENKQIVAYKNLDELQQKIEGYSFRVLKSDCLDLPEKLYQTRYVELAPDQRKLYDKIRRDIVAEYEAGRLIDASHALTRLLRLQQVTSGFALVGDDVGENTVLEALFDKPEDNPKIAALLSVFEEYHGKALIFCRFRWEVNEVRRVLAKHYGKDAVMVYHGGCNDDERNAARAAFKRGVDHPARFLVATRAASIGLTLTAANMVVYISNTFSLEDRLQSEDRAHRIGQDANVTYVDIVADRTIDAKILKALKSKKNVADYLVGDGVKQWLSI